MIFDVKKEAFWHKARMVASGHMLDPPATVTYSSVVCHEIVNIALTILALNDLEAKAADVQNAYIIAL
eukprot:9644942-Ditylum_brightwellii.AAC.1